MSSPKSSSSSSSASSFYRSLSPPPPSPPISISSSSIESSKDFWILCSLMSISVQEMDLDLNQEPFSDSGLMNELSPWLNELETAHERIEERIRQLESIVSRIRNRETTTTTTRLVDSTVGVIHERSRERLVENGGGNKKTTHLIAKALNMEKSSSSIPGGYFDCNICLEKAENPILTCCGHLFCWGCFYQLPLIYLNIKECPVCDGEVTDSEVIPIYGNGDDSKPKLEDCGISLPPRPTAKRVESVRQKIINRGIPFIPVQETIEHIRRTIDSIGLQALAQGDEFGLTNIITNEQRQAAGIRPVRLPPPHLRTFASSFPGLVVDTSSVLPSPPQQPPRPFVNDVFDVDSFVDTTTTTTTTTTATTSLRRNRRRSLRIAEISTSPQDVSFRVSPVRIEFGVPRSQTMNPEVVVTSASSSRRRTEEVDNGGPRTRSRRRLR